MIHSKACVRKEARQQNKVGVWAARTWRMKQHYTGTANVIDEIAFLSAAHQTCSQHHHRYASCSILLREGWRAQAHMASRAVAQHGTHKSTRRVSSLSKYDGQPSGRCRLYCRIEHARTCINHSAWTLPYLCPTGDYAESPSQEKPPRKYKLDEMVPHHLHLMPCFEVKEWSMAGCRRRRVASDDTGDPCGIVGEQGTEDRARE